MTLMDSILPAQSYQQAHRLRLIRTPGKRLILADREWPSYLLGEPDVNRYGPLQREAVTGGG